MAFGTEKNANTLLVVPSPMLVKIFPNYISNFKIYKTYSLVLEINNLLQLFSVKRNKRGENNLYISKLSPHFKSVQKLYKLDKTTDEEKSISFDGMSGTISSSECNVVLQGYVLYVYILRLTALFTCST